MPRREFRVADNVAHVIFRGNDFDLHHWLKQLHASHRNGLAETCASRDFEMRQPRRSTSCVLPSPAERANRSVGNQQAYRRQTGPLKALLHARNVFLWYGTTDDLGLKAKTFASVVRLNHNRDLCELTGTTGLLLVRVRVLDTRVMLSRYAT